VTAAPVLVLSVRRPAALDAARVALAPFDADLLAEADPDPTRALADGLRPTDLAAASAPAAAVPGVLRARPAWSVAVALPDGVDLLPALTRAAMEVLDVRDGTFGVVRHALFPTREAALLALPCA
jgi:hypothetical protein